MSDDKLSRRQAAIIGAYTGYLCGPFSEMHEYIEEIMGRPVWTHEMGSEAIADQIKDSAKDDFIQICRDSK